MVGSCSGYQFSWKYSINVITLLSSLILRGRISQRNSGTIRRGLITRKENINVKFWKLEKILCECVIALWLLDGPFRKNRVVYFIAKFLLWNLYNGKKNIQNVNQRKGSVNLLNYSMMKGKWGMWTSQDHCKEKKNLWFVGWKQKILKKWWHSKLTFLIKSNFSCKI